MIGVLKRFPANSNVTLRNFIMTDCLQKRLSEVVLAKQKRLSNWIIEEKLKLLWTNYQKESIETREKFLKNLATEYYIDKSNLSKAASDYLHASLQNQNLDIFRAQEKLSLASTPSYVWIFHLTGRCVGGVHSLVSLRRDLIDLINKSVLQADESIIPLQQLNTSLRDLLSLWFGVGFLTLERITFLTQERMLFEISKYEAVHPLSSRSQLESRLGPYRRCHIFTHGSMPGVPLIVLYTALLPEIADKVQPILNQNLVSSSVEDSNNINAAVFYSISSTQKGLQGVDLGNYLIKRVVHELKEEYPSLEQFSSLSPIPGYRKWLLERLKKEGDRIFNQKELNELKNELGGKSFNEKTFLRCLSLNPVEIFHKSSMLNLIRGPLLRLCAHYLYNEKRRGYALNSVAHFHLRNGSQIWRINWMADTSERGLDNSLGIMVNYRYFLDQTESNVQRYIEHKEISAHDKIKELAKESDALVSKL